MKRYYLKILYNKKVDLSNYYTKSETDSAISSHTIDLSGYYTKAEINNLLSQYAKSTSIPNMSQYVKYGDYVYFKNTDTTYNANNHEMYSLSGSGRTINDNDYSFYSAIKKY